MEQLLAAKSRSKDYSSCEPPSLPPMAARTPLRRWSFGGSRIATEEGEALVSKGGGVLKIPSQGERLSPRLRRCRCLGETAPRVLTKEESLCESLGDPWLDRLPGLLGGVFFRARIEHRFLDLMQGEAYVYDDNSRLKLHLLRPVERLRKVGCVIFLHGGGFVGSHPSQFYPYMRAVAREFGLNAACIEVHATFSHPCSPIPWEAYKDARKGVQYLVDHAEQLHLDSAALVLCGTSSGGHTAAMAACGANSDAPLDLAAVVLWNPCLDLEFTADRQHREKQIQFTCVLLKALFGQQALGSLSPVNHVKKVQYGLLLITGEKDRIVPLSECETYAERMSEAGNYTKLVVFGGEGHYFFNLQNSEEHFHRCVELLGEHLRRTGVLQPAVAAEAEAKSFVVGEEERRERHGLLKQRI